MDYKIDFVVTWLDSSDPVWQEDYRKYKNQGLEGDTDKSRFRDWDLFQFWFRAIENNAPWVNKIFLVTNGKFPDWINEDHPKLVLVKHSDYIPKEFLPTFNSCTIELHMHKIPGLSEHFVYFNDDCYLNNPVTPDYYFKEGLPCDSNAETVFNVPVYDKAYKFGIYPSMLTDIGVINGHFNRWKTVRQSMKRWFGPHLGLGGILLSYYLRKQGRFVGFQWRHYEHVFLKSTFYEAWEKESDMLNKSCTRFREDIILNPYFFRYWQFASNKFYPVKLNSGINIRVHKGTIRKIISTLHNEKIKSLCLNDTPYCKAEDFEEIKSILHSEFSKKFPNKSSFEM